jgi:pyroglutamyl-peptidase
MKNILITGFEPFDNDSINPSQEFIKYLKNISTKHILHTAILPVSFDNSFTELTSLVESVKPDLILLTGFAKNRQKIGLEKVGINWIDARIPDNNGRKVSAQKIDPNGLDAHFSLLNLNELFEKMSPADFEISYSAGTYVCNFLYYKSLSKLKLPQVFIHLPGPSTDINFKIFDSLVELIELL